MSNRMGGGQVVRQGSQDESEVIESGTVRQTKEAPQDGGLLEAMRGALGLDDGADEVDG